LAQRVRERVGWRVDHIAPAGDPAAADALEEAANAADALCASAGEILLIHGDFQEKNVVLRADGAPVVIDPLPCLGERAFDAALAALTSRSGLSRDRFIARICAQVGCDAARVDAWASVLLAIIGAEHVTPAAGG
jgi:streptomycin 6-kinase